jgi:prepilin-type N-terminal cleavage/methylation domain-containing protein
MSPERIQRCHGFTLAELLIAILILSLVLSLTYAAFNTTFTSVDSGDASSRFGERARITLERISEDLQSFYGGENGFFQGESESFAMGRADLLSFTSRAHLRFNREQQARGVTAITYTVEEVGDSGELRLYRNDAPVLPGVEAEEEKGFLLCEGLREMAFTYVDEEGGEFDRWDSSLAEEDEEVEYPRLVRIKIGFFSAETDEEDSEENVYFSTAIALPTQG